MRKLLISLVILGFLASSVLPAFALDTFYDNKEGYDNQKGYENKIPYSMYFVGKPDKVKLQKGKNGKAIKTDVPQKESKVEQKGLEK